MALMELVIVPVPGAGHLRSAIDFAKLLVSRDHRLSATVLIIQNPLKPKVHNSPPGDDSINFVQLPFDDDAARRYLSRTPFPIITDYVESHKPHVRRAVAEICRSDSPSRLVALVLDMFSTSMIKVADEFGIPSYVYYTSGAAYLGLCLHLQTLTDHHNMDISYLIDADTQLQVSTYVNRVPAMAIPTIILEGPGAEIILTKARRFRKTKGIIVNTFLDLEPHAIDALSNDPSLPGIYAVGPIISESDGSDCRNERDHHWGSESLVNWLDKQPASSVVFLCFGSHGSFGELQLKEIAQALERSGFRFLWSLRKPPVKGSLLPEEYENPEEVLPEGFLERTTSRGKVIGWAPQLAVLRHPAVGGFVSHCGWNSTLESVCSGVPMATWPMYAEQQMNAFHIVEEIGIGVEVKMDYGRKFMEEPELLKAELIESSIRRLMAAAAPAEDAGGRESKMRKKVKEMEEKSRSAVVEGGSSYEAIGRLIDDIINGVSLK